MAIQKIIYQITNKRIPAVTGIGLVGDILEHAEFQERFGNVKLEEKRSKKQINPAVIIDYIYCTALHGQARF